MSSFWSWYIILITAVNILGCWWLIHYTQKTRPGETLGQTELDHKWDGDLVEYNHALPRWWLYMFHITLVFGVVYLFLYPGAGSFKGFLGWTSTGQYEQEMAEADATFGALYRKYAAVPLTELSSDQDALNIGRNLFANNCAVCHASDARGAVGFPNLADNDWLWGGTPDQIKQSISAGRKGTMPAWLPTIGEDGVTAVAAYIGTLSGGSADRGLAAKGETTYQTLCIACHGAVGKGNQALGSPDLTDQIWLYGNSNSVIYDTIANGRAGEMPAHSDLLGPEKVHLVAAYVVSLGEAGGQ